MSKPVDERVLVVPTAILQQAGIFQGFCNNVDHYLPRLLDPEQLSFLPRSRAEHDPSFKQIIPYVVFQWQDQVFHYQRGSGSTEARLRALRSVGVGGHISEEDAKGADELYRTGMRREVDEEVFLDSEFEETCIGLINDDRTPVGQVHIGVVHVFRLDQPSVRKREEVITQAGFAPIAQLQLCDDEFETWSQFLLADGVLENR